MSEYKVAAAIAVSDMDRARAFYEGKLGLSLATDHEPDDNRAYRCGEGVALHREWMIRAFAIALADEVEGVAELSMSALSIPRAKKILSEL